MAGPGFGALVISLDFELHWGVRDTMPPNGPYRENLLGARTVIPRILDMFDEFDVAATWATVGFLFARSRAELDEYSPVVRPNYLNPALDPYVEPVGDDESADPLHFAAGLIAEIRKRRRQEIATHTYSHFYCMEGGATVDAFRSDLESAVRLAKRQGIRLRSIVLPRNQFHPGWAGLLRDLGILAYRGTEKSWMYRASDTRTKRVPWARASRLLDAYVPLTGANTASWSDVAQKNGLYNVPSSCFLRQHLPRLAAIEGLRLQRILGPMRSAAETGTIYHICWHPHNFGVNQNQNLAFLRGVLESFAQLRASHGMRSLSMWEAAKAVGAEDVEPAAQRSDTLVH